MEKETGINWSAIACQAFEVKLAEITAQKGARTMQDVIERLRVSKRQAGTEDYKAGYQEGEDWAKSSAEARELGRLEEMRQRLATEPIYGWDFFFDSTQGDRSYTTAQSLLFEIHPEDDKDVSASEEFWECAVAEESYHQLSSDQFLQGFAEGALNLWLEVKEHF